jgi:hypothetical protein
MATAGFFDKGDSGPGNLWPRGLRRKNPIVPRMKKAEMAAASALFGSRRRDGDIPGRNLWSWTSCEKILGRICGHKFGVSRIQSGLKKTLAA